MKGILGRKVGMTQVFTKDGKLLENGEKSFVDLFFLPIKKEGWINIYKPFCDFKIYKTKEEAEKIAKGYPDYTKTIKIEWEE